MVVGVTAGFAVGALAVQQVPPGIGEPHQSKSMGEGLRARARACEEKEEEVMAMLPET